MDPQQSPNYVKQQSPNAFQLNSHFGWVCLLIVAFASDPIALFVRLAPRKGMLQEADDLLTVFDEAPGLRRRSVVAFSPVSCFGTFNVCRFRNRTGAGPSARNTVEPGQGRFVKSKGMIAFIPMTVADQLVEPTQPTSARRQWPWIPY